MTMPKVPKTIMKTALDLHERGFWIVPCDGKKPVWPEWPTKKRTAQELTEALEGTKLNIGIALNQSNFMVHPTSAYLA